MMSTTLSPAAFSSDKVAQYYRETGWQYRFLWTGKHSLALHYGYWTDGVTTHVEGLHKLNEVMADIAAVRDGDVVLDAGCGWGGSAIWLAQRHRVRAHGISIEPDQIARARRKSQAFGVSDAVEFSVQDYTRTNFPDQTFDVVWAIESTCYCHDKREFCREAYQVLKPGGRLIVGDLFRSNRFPDARRERRLRRLLDQWVVPDLDTFEEFSAHASAAGFSKVSVEDITANIRPSSRRMCALGVLTSPVALALRLVNVHSSLQHENWKSSILQYRLLRQRLWKYGIVAATKPAKQAATEVRAPARHRANWPRRRRDTEKT